MRRGEAARALEALSAAPLLRGLAVRRLRQVVAASRIERYQPGAPIVQEGSLGDALHVVVEGRVVVQTSHLPDTATRLATLGPGDYFGEMALLTGRPRVADVLADTSTEVVAIPRAAFESYLLTQARFKGRLIAQSRERENDLERLR